MFWLKTAEQKSGRTEKRKSRRTAGQQDTDLPLGRTSHPTQSRAEPHPSKDVPPVFLSTVPPKNHQRPTTPKYRKPLRPPYSVRGRNGGRFPGEDRTREEILSVSPPQFFLGSVFLLKKNGTNLKEKKRNIEEKKRLSPPKRAPSLFLYAWI